MPPSENKGLLSRTNKSEAPPIRKSWFLGIGINEYLHWPTLNNAVRDVNDISKLLQQNYDIDKAITLFDKEATRERIISELDTLTEQIQPTDKLLLYFSGHGHLNTRTGKGYWVPYDAPQDQTAKYIRNSTIKEYLQDIESKHTLLISDACFSGSLFVSGNSKNAELGLQDLERWRSRWALCSGRHDEKVYDGKPGGNSPFASSILKALQQQDGPLLNAMLLADRVYKLTAHQYEQRPRSGPIHGVGDEGGQYIFRLRQDEARAYAAAQAQDIITAYSTFLRDYPKGPRADAALARIVELEDDEAYAQAKEEHRLSSYHRYLRRHPTGRHVEAAQAAIEQLERGVEKATIRRIVEPSPPVVKSTKPKSTPNTFTDPRDGRTYRTIQLAGLTWLAENLNFDVGKGCWYYDDDLKNEAQYGRLYTWEAAKRACPAGWRLPTDEEWQQLAKAHGGYYDYSSKKDVGDPKKAYQALIDGGSSGFSARLGGRRYSNGSFSTLGVNGHYWSATERDSGVAWYYHFDGFSRRLDRDYDSKSWGFSCRCIQDLSI